jgi:16S rRNA (guanine(1405)-N(7))-methyltransferase
MIAELKKILTDEILNTKNLKSLDYDYVYSKLEKFILTYGDIFKKLRLHVEKKGLYGIEKNKYFKEIVKRIRSELNIVYSSYLTNDFFKKNLDLDVNDLLKLHKSTKERFEFFDEIYSKIFNWYTPKKIADLACGLNPLSYFLIKGSLGKDVKYFASDLSSNDMDFVQSFFDKNKIDGVAKGYDITKLDFLEDCDFKASDLVFLFKALDSFEEVKKDISKEILDKIPANKIVISFPTKSLQSKVKFKIERRNWLFNYLKRRGWEYETFEVDNELFILVSKN